MLPEPKTVVEKIKVSWPEPKTIFGVRSLHGLATFDWHFINYFSFVMAPTTKRKGEWEMVK